ncbi:MULTISPECIES: DUF7322 domain-containing protein [Halorussus]|uniref:DUF7322 domain-containing protein n=1 Tax=Halorussus TaxID=1070314 RepID=UPI00209DEE32|nr:hypothetical protein [Halorussus vallis]USZ75453.1 hypothetical protein NGM07_18720 [Halorussus vallis]
MLPDDRAPEEAEAEQRGTDLIPDDPGERFRESDDETLGLEVPSVPEFSADDADPELRRQFWSLVLLFNVALFGMSLGLMLVGFEGRLKVGGAIFLVGLVAFLRGLRGYRKVNED